MFSAKQAKKVLLVLFWVALLGGGLYLFFGWLLPLFLPFVLAWLFAFALQPLIDPLHRRTHLPRKLLAVLLVALLLFLLIGLLTLLCNRLLYEARTLLSTLTSEENGLPDSISALILRLRERIPFLSWLPEPTPAAITDYLSSLLKELSLGLSALLPRGISFLTSTLPRAIFFFVVLLLSAFYFSADFQGCNQMLLAKLPSKVRQVLRRLGKEARIYSISYLRA